MTDRLGGTLLQTNKSTAPANSVLLDISSCQSAPSCSSHFCSALENQHVIIFMKSRWPIQRSRTHSNAFLCSIPLICSVAIQKHYITLNRGDPLSVSSISAACLAHGDDLIEWTFAAWALPPSTVAVHHCRRDPPPVFSPSPQKEHVCQTNQGSLLWLFSI